MTNVIDNQMAEAVAKRDKDLEAEAAKKKAALKAAEANKEIATPSPSAA